MRPGIRACSRSPTGGSSVTPSMAIRRDPAACAARHAGYAFHVRFGRRAGARQRPAIIAPDCEGYALTGFRASASLLETTDDLREFADALGLDRFAVAGISGGGPHAVAPASAMPECVLLLALVSPCGPIADHAGEIGMTAPQQADLQSDRTVAEGFVRVLLGAAEPGAVVALKPPTARCPST
jgi:pimeloyl-ACP methyl ester carboxylesterase